MNTSISTASNLYADFAWQRCSDALGKPTLALGIIRAIPQGFAGLGPVLTLPEACINVDFSMYGPNQFWCLGVV
jgi:hypothetical protein